MADYMDYPFLCDEKLGDRCKAQCATCKAADTPNRFKSPVELSARIAALEAECARLKAACDQESSMIGPFDASIPQGKVK